MSDTEQNTSQEENTPAAPNELDVLRDRAKLMGITFSGNTGVETLRSKIAAKLAGEAEQGQAAPEEEEEETVLNPLEGDTAGEVPTRKLSLREQIRRDALKLVRVRIQNLDPKKANLHGEICTIGNKYVGTVKKFVPYGEATDEGYHIPYILYENLKERKFLHIRTFKDPVTKRDRVETSWQREFAFEVLPQLTPDELGKLAAAQLAASNA